MSVAVSAAAVVLSPGPAEAAAAVQVYRVNYDPSGADTRVNAQLNREWVQIKNKGARARQLRGWKLKDETGYTYTFGTFTLKPGKTVYVHTGRGTSGPLHRYWGRAWYVWNNTGDTAYLRRPNGTLADSCSWGDGGGLKTC